MNYQQKLEALNLTKERLQKRLSILAKREKSLASHKRKEARKNLERRKYQLGGVVILAMSECDIYDFDESEILGCLVSVFQSCDLEKLYTMQTAGEKIFLQHRQSYQQSASAQGFKAVEVAEESKEDSGLMDLIAEWNTTP